MANVAEVREGRKANVLDDWDLRRIVKLTEQGDRLLRGGRLHIHIHDFIEKVGFFPTMLWSVMCSERVGRNTITNCREDFATSIDCNFDVKPSGRQVEVGMRKLRRLGLVEDRHYRTSRNKDEYSTKAFRHVFGELHTADECGWMYVSLPFRAMRKWKSARSRGRPPKTPAPERPRGSAPPPSESLDIPPEKTGVASEYDGERKTGVALDTNISSSTIDGSLFRRDYVSTHKDAPQPSGATFIKVREATKQQDPDPKIEIDPSAKKHSSTSRALTILAVCAAVASEHSRRAARNSNRSVSDMRCKKNKWTGEQLRELRERASFDKTFRVRVVDEETWEEFTAKRDRAWQRHVYDEKVRALERDFFADLKSLIDPAARSARQAKFTDDRMALHKAFAAAAPQRT